MKTNNLVLAIEYMDGGSLKEIVDAGGCKEEEFLAEISYNVLRGLHFLHGQNKIHRDIKPGNLLLHGRTGVVKISDFGLTTALDKANGLVVGTKVYLAPERLENIKGRTGPAQGQSSL
jgi:serine/threonine protein kinase